MCKNNSLLSLRIKYNYVIIIGLFLYRFNIDYYFLLKINVNKRKMSFINEQ